MKECLVVDLGLAAYRTAWELQRRIVQARKAGMVPDVLLLCEHPHVITLGRNGHSEHLRASDHLLRQMGVEFCSSDRGGDITYHGPGQLVGYPILHLAKIRRDVVWYVRQLEEAMIRATADLGVRAGRQPGAHQPLGDLTRLRLQRCHRPALFRSDRALRHSRYAAHLARTPAGPLGEHHGSSAADRRAVWRGVRARDAPGHTPRAGGAAVRPRATACHRVMTRWSNA